MQIDLTHPDHERAYLCAARNYIEEIPDWPAARIREALLGEEMPAEIILFGIYELDDGPGVAGWIEDLAVDILETFFPEGTPHRPPPMAEALAGYPGIHQPSAATTAAAALNEITKELKL